MPPIPKTATVPPVLHPFVSFGVLLDWSNDGTVEAVGGCPFCDKENKFYVNRETGQWSCKVCQEEGNVYTFLRRVYEEGSTAQGDLEALAEDRGVEWRSLLAWGLKRLDAKDEWMVPGYDASKRMNNVYRRTWDSLASRWYLQGAKGLNHCMFGLGLFDPKKENVYVCEGVWDGIALWEVLQYTKLNPDETFGVTADPKKSLWATSNVIAVPSCSVFSQVWSSLFADKRVYLCYHNDHPDKGGRCAGPQGMKSTARLLMTSATPPKEVLFVNWGGTDDGLSADLELKKGYDLRDAITVCPPDDKPGRVRGLAEVLHRITPIPVGWVEGATKGKNGKVEVLPLECDNWVTVRDALDKAIVVTEGIDRALCFMLACAASVDVGGDQLWGKVISPPSGGKTTLADGIVLNKKYACLKSITTGLHSGWRADGEDGEKGGEDVSLMAAVKGKCMVVKDADSIMQAPNLPQILSEFRDAYDRSCSTHYRNAVARDYENHSFVVLFLGTFELRKMDRSELGQRFVDCVIMEGIDKALETEINRRSAAQFRALMLAQDSPDADGADSKDMSNCKRLIAGYLGHLRENMRRSIAGVKMSDAAATYLTTLAEFVAHFRARPPHQNKVVIESAGRELSTRLQRQFMKLAYCTAVVLGRDSIDDEVLRRVRQSAIDTARGTTLKVATLIATAERTNRPIDFGTIGVRTSIEGRELTALLAFLELIEVVERYVPQGKAGLGSKTTRYRLTDSIRPIYDTVFPPPPPEPPPPKPSPKPSPSKPTPPKPSIKPSNNGPVKKIAPVPPKSKLGSKILDNKRKGK